MFKEEDPPEQQKSPSLVQVKLEDPQIKEEPQDWSLSLVQVKLEAPQIKEEQEELLQREDGEAELLASSSKTPADVEDCGALQSTSDEQLLSSHRSDSDTEDSDDWGETKENHTRVQAGGNPFVCTVCNKTFRRNGHLKQHMLIHTGEKPFACTVCNKTFGRNGYLKDRVPTVMKFLEKF